ncbi:MAG: RNA-binding domain-containing protein [Halobacteria archaeon]
MVYSASVSVEVPVYDTEVEENVLKAVENVFPQSESKVEETDVEVPGRPDRRVVAETHSVERLKELIHRQDINRTTRDTLEGSIVGTVLQFKIKKQPATVGRLNFDVGGHELGSIDVHIESSDPEGLIEYLTGESGGDSE